MSSLRRCSVSLREAIEEFRKYSSRTSSLCERTETCFKELANKIQLDEAEVVNLVNASDQFLAVKKELQIRPSVMFIGEKNCGKSSIVNELLGQSSLPVHENPCTARIVRIKYAEKSYAQLISIDGKLVEEVAVKDKHLPKNLIVVSDADRESKEALDAVVEVGLNHELLRSGLELIDSPGRNECDALDNVLDHFLRKDTVPLFVYVIDGDMHLRRDDKETLRHLKDKFPDVPYMYVCNKVDTSERVRKYDMGSHDHRVSGSCREEDLELPNGGNGNIGTTSAINDDDGNDDEDGDDDEASRLEHTTCKGEIVFRQLRKRQLIHDDSLQSSVVYHAFSAKEVRSERIKRNRIARQSESIGQAESGEATKRFERFESCLQNFLTEITIKQTRRVVRKLVVLQESFVNVVQVQRSLLTEKASPLPRIFQRAREVEQRMFESFTSIVTCSEELRSTVEENLQTLAKAFILEAEQYKVPKQKVLQRESQTMVKTEMGYLCLDVDIASQISALDFGLARFVSDMKGSILEKTHAVLDRAVQDLMTGCVKELTEAIIAFNSELRSPFVARILEESYDIQCIQDNLETNEVVQVMLNGVLDSIGKAVSIALRKEISEPLSKLYDLHGLSIGSKMDIQKKSARQEIVKNLLATIQHDHVIVTIYEACTSCLTEMHELFSKTISNLVSLERAFAKGNVAAELQEFRVHFTPRVRELAVEGIALDNSLRRGPVELGSLVTKTRRSSVYDCTSAQWCSHSPRGQCAVKVIERRRVGEARWGQTAVDLVNMMDISQKLDGAHPYLLRLLGWVQPEPDVLHLVMEKAQRGLLTALRGGLPLLLRMNIALDVAKGLKAIHEAEYVYEDLKPENVLLTNDGTAKINMAKPENPFEKTSLGEPFHISLEMYQFHGTGVLSSSAYDIYAFGMLLWVLCEGSGTTRPECYKERNTREEMHEAVEMSIFPEKPLNAMEGCWELMKTCWQKRNSITMKDVEKDVEKISKDCLASM